MESPFGPRRVTASLGVAPFANAEGVTAEELLVEADIAMYDAKDAGRDRVAIYNPTEDRQSLMHSRLTWADRIRSAIDEERFVLHAQPILSLGGDEAPRHELLVRMVGDDGDPIPPGTFLYVAERFDLVQDIDRWVLREAIRLLADEQRAGNDIRLDVNISAKSLDHPRALDRRRQPARRHRRRRARAVPGDHRDRGDRQHRPRQALRHARSGSSAARWRWTTSARASRPSTTSSTSTFDYLKIDGEFIAGLPENRTNQLVVRSIVDIARGMGKRTIAEFVGDAETLALLRSYGVDYAQGYHVAKPRAFASGDLSRAATVEAA